MVKEKKEIKIITLSMGPETLYRADQQRGCRSRGWFERTLGLILLHGAFAVFSLQNENKKGDSSIYLRDPKQENKFDSRTWDLGVTVVSRKRISR